VTWNSHSQHNGEYYLFKKYHGTCKFKWKPFNFLGLWKFTSREFSIYLQLLWDLYKLKPLVSSLTKNLSTVQYTVVKIFFNNSFFKKWIEVAASRINLLAFKPFTRHLKYLSYRFIILRPSVNLVKGTVTEKFRNKYLFWHDRLIVTDHLFTVSSTNIDYTLHVFLRKLCQKD
jgi:hypothetical protein